MNAKELLKTKKSYAIIGVSQDETKYSYEVFDLMRKHSYKVFPVNPKYSEVGGDICYSSVDKIPEKIEVIMLIMAPENTNKMLDKLINQKHAILWFPPECFSDITLEKASNLGFTFVYDECPVGILKGF